jgi:hypothetical protein
VTSPDIVSTPYGFFIETIRSVKNPYYFGEALFFTGHFPYPASKTGEIRPEFGQFREFTLYFIEDFFYILKKRENSS